MRAVAAPMAHRGGALARVVRVVLCIGRKQLSSIASKSAQTVSIELQIALQKFHNPFRKFQFISGTPHLSMGYRQMGRKNNDSAVDRPRLSPPAWLSSFCLRFGFLRSVRASEGLAPFYGRGRPGAVSARPQGPRSLVAPEGEPRRPRIPGVMIPGS